MGRQSVTASAPSRIDLAGGTLDIWPLSQLLHPAVTVNVAIELRAIATISSRAGRRVEIVSRDRKRRATRRLPLGPADLHGPLALPLRLLSGFAPRRGLHIVCEATAPAGAGLGGSSTLGVALGAALNRHTAAGLGKRGLLRRVMNLETIELGVPTFVIPGNRETQTVYTAAMENLQAQHPNVFDIREHKVDLQGVNLVGMGGYHHPRFTVTGGFLLTTDDYRRARRHLEELQPQQEPTVLVTHGPPLASTRIDLVARAGHVGDKNIRAIMDASFKSIINVHGHIHEGGGGLDRFKAGPAYNVSAVTSFNNPRGPNAGLIIIADGEATYGYLR
jgi:hypothetical protein